MLLLTAYLTIDYCDPSIPGVFFFETESFFVESVDFRGATRAVLLPSDGPAAAQQPVAALEIPVPSRANAYVDDRRPRPRRHVLKVPLALADRPADDD